MLQICPLVTKAVSDMNPRLQTLNGKRKHNPFVSNTWVSWCQVFWETFYLAAVLAKVDKHAEIEYSMVSPPAVSASAIDLNLKVRKNCIPLYSTFKDRLVI